MHNAGTIAGMAFGNAFLGIVHAMSHTLGATFHVAHGRTNALLLPHVIRYNGARPGKLTGWPKYENYQAPQRFQEIAGMLGLPAGTPQEGVESLAVAVERLRDAVGIERCFAEIGVRRAALPGGAAAAGGQRLRRPVRPGQPPDADAGRHAGADDAPPTTAVRIRRPPDTAAAAALCAVAGDDGASGTDADPGATRPPRAFDPLRTV